MLTTHLESERLSYFRIIAASRTRPAARSFRVLHPGAHWTFLTQGEKSKENLEKREKRMTTYVPESHQPDWRQDNLILNFGDGLGRGFLLERKVWLPYIELHSKSQAGQAGN